VRVFSEVQAAELDANVARSNLIAYSRIVEKQSQQINILVKKVEELQQYIYNQDQQMLLNKELLDQLKQVRFGRSSERRGPLPLFDGPPKEEEPESKPGKKPRKGHGRKSQPKLPVEEVKYPLSDDEIKERGLELFAGQYEVSELITFKGPELKIERILRLKYFETLADGSRTIITAPGPLKLTEKSRYSIDFGIQTGLDKYESHLPLNRQVKRFAELGLNVSAQALYDQIDQIAWLLKANVVEPIHQFILNSLVIQSDDTWWYNLADKKKFYLWAAANEQAVSFMIYNARSQEVVEDFLKGFTGVLLTDGHSSFKTKTDAKLANDWAHARRKFIKAEGSYPQESQWFIERIRALSKIESEIKGQPPQDVLLARQERSKPIVDEIKNELLNLNGRVLPSGSLSKAVNYSLNLWTGLNVFLDDPRVPMTTNYIERLLRSPVVGRKGHYGSRTVESARTAASWYTVVATCEINNVPPRRYINYALTEILSGRKPVLPWNWAPS